MSKYIQSIPLSQIKQIAILPGNGRSLAAVKGDANLIINGGFYQFGSMKPTGHLKTNGSVLAKESWNCWGFCWNSGSDIHMDVVPNSGSGNYISGVELLTRDLNANSSLRYPSEVGGKRGRTALAIAESNLFLYCSEDGSKDAVTPETLRNELVALGAKFAIMLDGGGSSQCDFFGKTITSSRSVHNYIAIWLKEESPLPGSYKVNAADGLKIRKGPGTHYPRTGLYPHKSTLSLLEILGDWGRTDRGWVYLDYLTFIPPSDQPDDVWDRADTKTLFQNCQPDDPLTCRQAAQILQTLGFI